MISNGNLGLNIVETWRLQYNNGDVFVSTINSVYLFQRRKCVFFNTSSLS